MVGRLGLTPAREWGVREDGPANVSSLIVATVASGVN
jgi:hypothetical protein